MLESLLNKVASLRDFYFEEHLRTTASVCNIIRKNKSVVSHLTHI